MESEHKPSLSHDWPMVSYMVPLFHGKIPVAKVYGPTPESSEDRAKLFASARDMLAALQKAEKAIGQITLGRAVTPKLYEKLVDAHRGALSAIAKARGEQ